MFRDSTGIHSLLPVKSLKSGCIHISKLLNGEGAKVGLDKHEKGLPKSGAVGMICNRLIPDLLHLFRANSLYNANARD
jgi:hypothetical protein